MTEPRKPGMVCLCGYWGKLYVVCNVREVRFSDGQLDQPSILCLWEDDWLAAHQTAWDPKKDRIIWDGEGDPPASIPKDLLTKYAQWKSKAEYYASKGGHGDNFTGD